MYYEIYVKPEGGPCMVQERDHLGRFAWTDKAEAISIAQGKKVSHPHMDFLVHEVQGNHGPRSVAYDTSKDESKPITVDMLVKAGYTLNRVDDMVHLGQLSVETANAFFQVWVAGKSEFRWNEVLNQPEKAIYLNPYLSNQPPVWVRYLWG